MKTVSKDNAREEVAGVRRVAFAGAAVNLLIAGAKFAGGIAFASQALLADAVHSLSDLVTDAALVLGVRFWVSPADEDHPYGHGKIEAVVTAFIGLMIAGVAVKIGWNGIDSLLRGDAEAPGLLAFFVALVSVVAKEGLYRWTHAVAKRLNSPATEANAWHHRSDAISSIPVAVAVAVAHFFPSLTWVDAAGAVLVGVFILHVAWQIAKPAFLELTDATCGVTPDEVERRACAAYTRCASAATAAPSSATCTCRWPATSPSPRGTPSGTRSRRRSSTPASA